MYFPIGLEVKEGMSTKIEPSRKFVAHDEKSKFLIFRPEIPYGGPRNVKYFFERHKTPLEISFA